MADSTGIRVRGRAIRGLLGLVFLILGGLGAASAAEMRTWTDASGQHKIKATFLKLEGDKVFLQRENGGKFQIDLNKLSKPDRQYVEEHAAGGVNPFEAVEEEPAEKEPQTDAEETDVQEAELVEVNWGKARAVLMATAGDGEWKFTVEPPPASRPVKRKPLALPS